MAEFHDVLSGVGIRDAWWPDAELQDAHIHGEIGRLVVNGVDVGPFVEAEGEWGEAPPTESVAPGWPPPEAFPVRECLRIILNEEWEHDLDALGSGQATDG